MDLLALEHWLNRQVPGFQGPFTVRKFSGGQSNPTYLIEAQSGSYVLRRRPFGQLLPSAHAVDREFRVMSTLHSVGFPVPRTVALCNDASILGAAFYVMEFLEGRVLYDGGLPGIAPPERRAIYEQMTETLAALHRLDPARIGLTDYGRPGNYFERQVSRWIKQYRSSQSDDLPVIEQLIAWLPRTLPQQSRISIVHGDYRIDNLIFATDQPRVRAVVDWELSTLGDPLADFSYFALAWVSPESGPSTLVGRDLDALGIPTLEEIATRYCRAAGMDSLPQLAWYFAFNLFRVAVIVQGIKKRAQDGSASSDDAAAIAERVGVIAAAAGRFAQLG